MKRKSFKLIKEKFFLGENKKALDIELEKILETSDMTVKQIINIAIVSIIIWITPNKPRNQFISIFTY